MAKKNSLHEISKISLLLLSLILLFFFLLPGQNIYQKNENEKIPPLLDFPLTIPTPAPYPMNLSGVLSPQLSAEAILVIDLPSQIVLLQKNPQMRLAPASTTKLMTALVALDQYKLDDVLLVEKVISEGKTMDLAVGDKLTVENLLYGLLVHSANDAAFVLAQNYPGGEDRFMEKMNQKAREFSLEDTHFTNPAGFEENAHYTSARDLARLATIALNNPTIAKIVGTPAITVHDVGFTRFYKLENVNALLGKIPGVLGVKTGWTENAGECLITALNKNGKKILIVVLGSQDRFGETNTLINWVFGNFTWQIIEPSRKD